MVWRVEFLPAKLEMYNTGTSLERQVAVLIDFENVGLNSIQWLFDQISDIGRITVKRAYTDWSTVKGKRDQLLHLGIEPIHLFTWGASGKNSSDIRLVIDAVDLLYQSQIDTFVIVSSDSDFVPLVSKLRAAGKSVIGAGRQATVSRSLVISCDRYFYLDQPKSQPRLTAPRSDDNGESLLIRAMTAAMDDEGRVVGSKLRQTMQRLDPSFDFRDEGHATFTKYLETSSGVKVIRPAGPGDVSVELSEGSSSQGQEVSDSPNWPQKIDEAWSTKAPISGSSIPGPSAAIAAADILEVSKLSSSKYKTLQSLLDSSQELQSKWYRSGNTIIRK